MLVLGIHPVRLLTLAKQRMVQIEAAESRFSYFNDYVMLGFILYFYEAGTEFD